MDIQSFSIVVPTKGCVNNCKFCVSKMHNNDYENQFDQIQYCKRIKYGANNRINTLILTGTGEVLQNKTFLANLLPVLEKEGHPFPNVELQTTGVMLINPETLNYHKASPDSKNIELLKMLGVNTISLSVSDIFDDKNNHKIIGTPNKLKFKLHQLCLLIKREGFNLRLSLNMTNLYYNKEPKEILDRCKELGADQITFRKLFSEGNSAESRWVKNNSCSENTLQKIKLWIAGGFDKNEGQVVKGYGIPGPKLPFGPRIYSINKMSTAVDDDCMAKENNDEQKYVILRENGKLYWAWDDEGSLIF